MDIFRYLLFALLGFSLGSVLFSYHLPKLLKGVDICVLSADHNPGTANAFHHAGVPVGILCLLCDLTKGFVPVFLAMRSLDPRSPWFALVIAAPALGHAMAPLYHHRGGKAIAATFGALLGLLPVSFLVFVLAALYLFFSLVRIIRPNERRTVVVFTLFAALAVADAAQTGRWPFALGAVLLSLTVIAKNIQDAKLEARAKLLRQGKHGDPEVSEQHS